MSIDLQWRDEYSIDHSILDTQHKWLLKLAEHMLEIDFDPDDQEQIKTAVLQLFQYVEYHFDREIKLAQSVKHPQLEDHKAAHRVIIGKMNEMMTSCTNMHDLRLQLKEVILDWILNHIAILDKNLAQFVKKSKRVVDRHP
jgi:hemerythrin-like metal-binding protein